MGVGNRPFFPRVLEGHGPVEHVFKRDLRGMPNFPKQDGIEELFCGGFVTHDEMLFPSRYTFSTVTWVNLK